MSGQAAPRGGQPLIFIAVLLGLWIGARLILWENPWPLAQLSDVYRLAPAMAGADAEPAPALVVTDEAPGQSADTPVPARAGPAGKRLSFRGGAAQAQVTIPLAATAPLPPTPAAPPRPSSTLTDFAPVRPAPLPRAATPLPASRWRTDVWAFLRGSGERIIASPSAPSYGASQAGGVIAYRLLPESDRNPELYARGSKALIEQGEIEVAAGVRVAPVPAFPVRLHAELRATRFATETQVRPSAYVTAGIEETDLIADIEVRAYGQAGYVGGRYATGFVDGHAVAQKPVAQLGPARIGIGVGVWGGAQKGADRLDTGPSVSAEIDLAGAPVRLSADYRIQLAGTAAPGDGVAITLTTGF